MIIIVIFQSLQLSQKSLHQTSVGQVSNLMANDVNRMIDVRVHRMKFRAFVLFQTFH